MLLFLPASKLSLLVLSVDRLYAIIAPFKYRQRNHIKYGLQCFIATYTLSLFSLVLSAFYFKTSTIIREECATTNIMEKIAGLLYSSFLIVIDLVIYTLNIVFVVILKFNLTKSVIKSGTAAARAETARQVR